MKDLLFSWLFKALEIVLAGGFGLAIYLLLFLSLSEIWAIIGLSIIMYFWSALFRPYIDTLRKWLYAKITGIDEL